MATAGSTFQNYVGGQWQGARSGKTFPNYNPATGDLLGHFPLSDQSDVDAAVAAAHAAFTTWRLVPAPKRGEILFRLGELLTRHKEELARIMTQEMGKVLNETRGDVPNCPTSRASRCAIQSVSLPASLPGTFPLPFPPGRCFLR